MKRSHERPQGGRKHDKGLLRIAGFSAVSALFAEARSGAAGVTSGR